MSKLRIAAAIIAMLLVQLTTGILLTKTTGLNGSVLQTVIATLAGAFAGGFIAKRGFVAPALLIWAAIWAYLLYILHSIAAAAGSESLSALLSNNGPALLFSGVAALVGAASGQKLSNHPRIAAAT